MDLISALKSKRKPPPPPPPPKPAKLASSSSQPQSTSKPSPSKKKGLGWPWDNPPTYFPLYTTTPNPNPTSNPITWLFNWELWVPPSLPESIEWIPTIRTSSQIHDIIPFLTDITTHQNRHITALLGFNEPEIPSQANLDVDEAVRLWREFVLPAKQKFGVRLGSPGMSSDVSKSKGWLDGFFGGLVSSGGDNNGVDDESGVDFLVVHWYGLRFEDMKFFLEDMYRSYGRPIWVNEFACSRMGNGETTKEEVLGFLREAVPWLEATDWIERYAYYGNGQGRDVGEWVGRINNFTEIADGCEDTDGRRLSEVGKLYLEL